MEEFPMRGGRHEGLEQVMGNVEILVDSARMELDFQDTRHWIVADGGDI